MSLIAPRLLSKGFNSFIDRLSVFLAIGLLSAGLSLSPAQAQENAQPASQACVSPAILRQLSRDGELLRVSAAAFASPRASGGTREQGIAAPASPSPDFLRALQEARVRFEKSARKEDPRAQVNLAVLALAGWGAPPNPGAALYWLTEAVHQNFTLAYFDLGVLYLNGCGVRRDYAEAFRFFRQAADASDPLSQLNLGYLYDQGLGVARNPAEAALWYRRAAEAGVPQAQFNLADLYLRGEDVSRDEAQAFSWFQKAGLQGHTAAQLMLGSMYAAGRGVAQDLSLAYMWFSVALLQGDSRAAAELAFLERQLPAPQIAAVKSRAQSLARAFASQPSSSSEVAKLH